MGNGITKTEQDLVVRRFTRPGDDIFKMLDWGVRQVELKDATGRVLVDKQVEAPLAWSDTAVTIAAYKYLRKRGLNTPEGCETSIRQLVHRVAHTIRTAGETLGYLPTKELADTFEDE